MSEKSRLYSLRTNVGNCSYGGIKYKLSALLYISYLTFNKILCIYVKALGSDFQLIPKMLVYFLLLFVDIYNCSNRRRPFCILSFSVNFHIKCVFFIIKHSFNFA